MSDRYFLDTNIFVYSLDPVEPRKAQVAESLVTRGVTSGLGIISYQVVQEFMNVSLRQFRATMTVTELELYFFKILLPMMRIPSSTGLFLEALRLQSANRLSWYDSLIVAAAIQGRCEILYSEDLQHGRRFGDLAVENPFL
ncbi:MAG: PIN domain-containing protein [Acidobacteriales bacterium]|nr:PIN domain-containing protein [Candidatus Koribacter versatilis]MBI3644556.1 PIN domain-containing protein [Terriglobales bacterium]